MTNSVLQVPPAPLPNWSKAKAACEELWTGDSSHGGVSVTVITAVQPWWGVCNCTHMKCSNGGGVCNCIDKSSAMVGVSVTVLTGSAAKAHMASVESQCEQDFVKTLAAKKVLYSP